MASDIALRIGEVKKQIESAEARAGRKRDDVSLLLVTKTVVPERIREAFDCGARDFGENRVQEFLEKKKALADLAGLRWHLIGHLQTNKVRQVIGETALIHSLDRPELAEEIERQAAKRGITYVDCLIQVNASGEESKFGLRPDDVETFAASLKGPAVRIKGLMTIGPLTEDETKIREAFRLMKNLQKRLMLSCPDKIWDTLSMGMSGDYPIAIEEGSTIVRIGTAVFGLRP